MLEKAITYLIEFIITIFAGKIVYELNQKKPRLVNYLTNVSFFDIPGQTPIKVGTHTITIQNMGKGKAEEIEVCHDALPFINVFPNIQYNIEETPQHGKILKFRDLMAKSSILISYFYVIRPDNPNFLPQYVKSKEGYAKFIKTIHTPIFSKWIQFLAGILMALGVVFILNLIYELIKLFISS